MLCLDHGPTQDVQQLLMSSTMGPLKTIDKTSWLLQSAHPFILAVQSMGPLMVYAHSCLMGPRGLYQGVCEIVTWAFTYTLSLTCTIMWCRCSSCDVSLYCKGCSKQGNAIAYFQRLNTSGEKRVFLCCEGEDLHPRWELLPHSQWD